MKNEKAIVLPTKDTGCCGRLCGGVCIASAAIAADTCFGGAGE
ncbi:hypothetical protein AB406_1497 [Riemerella anatipestifer]|uniref:Uncharacterized protein n=1 Tax=Riemerella anatipestifer TaxID=34085 RepID=A0A1S7DTI2_RIEAN|nr:hypothetical protein AB406_1497 [Riemerella anatipestifer]